MHALLPAPGDVVWIRQRRWRVQRASRHRSVVRLDVADRREQLTFLAPFDRPATVSRRERCRRVRKQSALARLSHLLARSHGVRTLLSAVRADVALLPHQLEPALAIFGGGARRVLIADEVGLGKTIQAGLVIAELTRRVVAPRILIAVPATLVDQWRDELLHRFDVVTETAGRTALEHLVRRGARDENPWNRAGVWLASLDYLKQPHVLAALPVRPWDLVVFDEAHGAAGDSDRHVAAQTIARRARRLILLTATPHDGDETRFGRLLGLGALGDDLTVFRRTRSEVAAVSPRRVRWQSLSPSVEERRVLETLAAFERAVLAAAGSTRRDVALLFLGVLRKRALSTMSALAISLERRQAWIEAAGDLAHCPWTQPSLFHATDVDDLDHEESGALSADVGLARRQERAWLKRLRALTDVARRHERKPRQLAALLRRSPEPVVIFTEFRHSLDALKGPLEANRTVAVLHGGQTAAERTRELARFLDGSASVLLATDVASLGLNLQTRARWVVSVELPWNPARLEQRLGRVDRIGQTRSVHFTVLTSRHPAEARVVEGLARRALLARAAMGDDMLRAVTPDATAIRESVLAGAPLKEPHATDSSVPICRRWMRIARGAARSLEHRRRLARRWRSAEPDHGRVRVATVKGTHTTCVFTLPIVDGNGATLEEHVVAVRAEMEAGSSDPASERSLDRKAIDAARERARRALTPRLARVRDRHRALDEIAAARERSIVASLADELDPREAQAGLFDRRVIHAFDAARQAAAEVRAGEEADDPDRNSHGAIEIGRPHLALLLRGR